MVFHGSSSCQLVLAGNSIAKPGRDFITKNNEILPDGVMRIGNDEKTNSTNQGKRSELPQAACSPRIHWNQRGLLNIGLNVMPVNKCATPSAPADVLTKYQLLAAIARRHLIHSLAGNMRRGSTSKKKRLAGFSVPPIRISE